MGETTRMREKLDTIATTLLILACLAVIGDVAWRRLSAASSTAPARAAATRPGAPEKLTWLGQTGFSRAERTVAIAIRESCGYCTASMPFYRELVAQQRQSSFRLVAVTTDSATRCEAYLRSHDVAVDDIVVVTPDRLGVQGTPTLIVIARDGSVEHVATGQLDPGGQKVLVDLLARERK
jgi:hypothetical protein